MDKIIRDPLWNNIRVDPVALRLVDTKAFQRLRYVRQLGLAYLVYPGATHTRFEHALGAYQLARRTLAMFEELGFLGDIPRGECLAVLPAHPARRSRALADCRCRNSRKRARPLRPDDDARNG